MARPLVVLLVAIAVVSQWQLADCAACQRPLDLELSMDGAIVARSASISSTDWGLLKKFAYGIASGFVVAPNNTHIGVVQFSSTKSSRYEIHLSSDGSAVLNTINNMRQIAGNTDLASGITLPQQDFNTFGRPKVSHIMIIITDGVPNEGADPVVAAANAKNAGTEIFCIGVGTVDFTFLGKIASVPAESHVFNVQDFQKLQEILDAIVAKSCLEVSRIQPSSGPSTGGTECIITGDGFQDVSTLCCKFGNTTVPARFGDAQHVLCKSPKGVGNTDVDVSVSLDCNSFSTSSASFHYQPSACPNNCSGHGVCFDGACYCNNGWVGASCDSLSCPNNCNGHGACQNGTCTCTQPWFGIDCGQNGCPNNCGPNGICKDNHCICNPGWSGPDCSQGEIICCRYCGVRTNAWWAECDVGQCRGFPDRKLVQSFPVNAKDVQDCILHTECIRNTGFCLNDN